MPFQILWADIESPVSSYGWFTDSSSTDQYANRLVFNGYFDAIVNANKGMVPGMYSAPGAWDSITGPYNGIDNTYESTYESNELSDPPYSCAAGFTTPSGLQAMFFGGQYEGVSAHAVMWQYSGTNSGDYDQIDTNLLPSNY